MNENNLSLSLEYQEIQSKILFSSTKKNIEIKKSTIELVDSEGSQVVVKSEKLLNEEIRSVKEALKLQQAEIEEIRRSNTELRVIIQDRILQNTIFRENES